MSNSKYTGLNALSKGSAKVATFVVRVHGPEIKEYPYECKKTRQNLKGHKFEVYLVGNNPEWYCIGFVKDSTDALGKAQFKFKNGSIWLLSKPFFDTYTGAQFINTSVPFRIDLVKSQLAPVGEDHVEFNELSTSMPMCPVPPHLVADVARITTTKSTDLLALVKSVSSPDRKTKSGDHIADVELIDNSERTPGKLAIVKVGVFGAAKIAKLRERVGQAMVFLNLSVACSGGSPTINHYVREHIREAPDCAKKQALEAMRDTLSNAVNTESLTSTWAPNQVRDVSGEQLLSCAAFLDYTSEAPNASFPEVMQLMWIHIEEPEPGSPVLESTGERLFYRVYVRDPSGSVLLGIPQRIALLLASCDTKEQFLRKHEEGALNHPLLCHARISRTVRLGSSGSGSFQPTTFVNHTLEQVEVVAWAPASAPNAAYQEILNMLNKCPAHNDGVLFAFLADLERDPHYGFRLNYDGHYAPQCKYAAVLLASESKSITENVGSGYKVIFRGVKDIANTKDGSGAAQPADTDAAPQPDGATRLTTYNAVGYCSLEDLTGFRLDPPRGKSSRCALCLFTKMDDEGFHVDKLEAIEPDCVQHAIKCMQRLRKLCKQLRSSSTDKRSHSMHLDSKASLSKKKARTLQALPTDASLPDHCGASPPATA